MSDLGYRLRTWQRGLGFDPVSGVTRFREHELPGLLEACRRRNSAWGKVDDWTWLARHKFTDKGNFGPEVDQILENIGLPAHVVAAIRVQKSEDAARCASRAFSRVPSRRGRPKADFDESKMLELAAQGLGAKRIAEELERWGEAPVSQVTVRRRLATKTL